jgi:thioredoxin 1
MELETLIKSEKPVLVDFWAEWCGPCRMMNPVIENIKKTNPNIEVVKVNVDEDRKYAAEYQVRSIPTLIIFKEGKQVWRNSGVLTEQTLNDKLQTII